MLTIRPEFAMLYDDPIPCPIHVLQNSLRSPSSSDSHTYIHTHVTLPQSISAYTQVTVFPTEPLTGLRCTPSSLTVSVSSIGCLSVNGTVLRVRSRSCLSGIYCIYCTVRAAMTAQSACAFPHAHDRILVYELFFARFVCIFGVGIEEFKGSWQVWLWPSWGLKVGVLEFVVGYIL